MELVKSDIQRELEGLIKRLMRDKNTFSDLQMQLTKKEYFNPALWSAFSELGLLSVPFSEQLGGTGGGFGDVAVVIEALGKGMCIAPFVSNVVLCGSLLPEDSQHLSALLRGEKLFAFAHEEPTEDPEQIEMTAELDTSSAPNSYHLSGKKVHIFGGDVADSFLVSAQTLNQGKALSGSSLFIVDSSAPGVQVKPYIMSDNMGAAEIVLDQASAQLIGDQGQALPVIKLAYDRATAALCAEAIGIMEALVEATVEYIKTRKQFGTAIGSFQVIQHMAADMLVHLEHARSLSLAANCYADCDDEAERTGVISAAKIGVNEAAHFVAKTAVQLHGGIGITEECAIGHYFRRLTAIRLSFGDSNYHLDRMAALESG